MALNCWEFKKCGREQGGIKANELGVCPAWPDHGTACARVAGTLCGGDVQGTFAVKVGECQQCDFYLYSQAKQHAGVLMDNLLELCPIGIIGVNPKGIITIFNPIAERLTGRKAGEIIGKESIANLYMDAGDAKQIKQMMLSPEDGGVDRLNGIEISVKGPDGQPVPTKLWGAILYEDGVEVGNVGFFYDLTDEKQAEHERIKQEKVQSVLEMAGAVLHHLAQPLQILMSDSSRLKREMPPDDPLLESVDAIKDSVDSISQMLQKIRNVKPTKTTDYVKGSKIVDLD